MKRTPSFDPKFFAFLVLVCALTLLLGGCASNRATGEFSGVGSPEAPFNAARIVLKRHRFELDRVDAQAGIITTAPKASAGLATPWDLDQTRLSQEFEDLGNHQHRQVRVTIARQAGGSVEASGDQEAWHAFVQVTIYRTQSPGLRVSSKAASLTTVTTDPQLSDEGLWYQYQTPVARDIALEQRLADEIERECRKL